jgi:predicted TIM-barrel fold metal-dependent hydrolase
VHSGGKVVIMIMGHCHVFPQGFGEKNADKYGIPGTVEHLIKFAQACGFSQAVAISPVESPPDLSVNARIDSGENGLDWLLGQPGAGTDKGSQLIPAAAIYPQKPGAGRKVQDATRKGVRLLKVHPLIMRCETLNPECTEFFMEAEKARMPIIYHTGGGDWNWDSSSADPEVCGQLAARYPELPILMAHCGVFGGINLFDNALKACREHSNIYLDITAALLPLGKDKWKKAIEDVGIDRIIYGNDYPWISAARIDEELELINTLSLSTLDREKILGDNLIRLIKK